MKRREKKRKKNGEMEMDGWGILPVGRIGYTLSFLLSSFPLFFFRGRILFFHFRGAVDSQICGVKGSLPSFVLVD